MLRKIALTLMVLGASLIVLGFPPLVHGQTTNQCQWTSNDFITGYQESYKIDPVNKLEGKKLNKFLIDSRAPDHVLKRVTSGLIWVHPFIASAYLLVLFDSDDCAVNSINTSQSALRKYF